uniref:Coiled-coil domain-containing protein 39 n=1 Tax=Dendroctonus ponderosae TaxID=77166 RepID=A0AAR5PF40_DENPD
MAYLEEILRKLGWDDGFQMPVANSENQALEQELAKLTLHKVKAKSILDNSQSRLTNLKEHFKFVTQENEQTQKIITAHKQQYDSEANQYHALKGEKNKLEHDVAEVDKRIKLLAEDKGKQKKNLEKAVIKVDRIKRETGWDIEALKAWEEALKKRDDDNELIKKFSKEDERRFNELEARRQFLQSEYDAKNFTISKMVCDLHSCEMIIERTGKAIKQQINERENLIKQWKDTVKMLQQRDADIDARQERILEAETVLEQQQEHLEEENSMLKNEQKNNHVIELELEQLNAANSRMRRELGDLQQTMYAIVNECHTLKRRVTASANNLEKLRIQKRQMDVEMDQKERKCIKDQAEMESIESKIAEMKGSNLSSTERIRRIRKLMESEEKRCSVLMADTEKINSNLYRTDQLLKDQQQVGKSLEIQINNSYCICNKLRKHIRDEEKSLEKLKEVVYDMEFRIDEFEQRLCKLEGSNKPDDHADEKDEKIRELETTLYDHAEVQHTLQSQVDRLQDEMRKLSNFIAADREHLENLQNQVENHLLVYDIGRKQIAAAKKSTQEKQVEENIMRLRINHIETDMHKEEKRIFSLQKLRLTLDQVMKERNLEIDTKRSIVLTKKRNLEEEKGRLKGDISIRKIKLEQFQKKYHIELMSLGKQPLFSPNRDNNRAINAGKDEDGQPLSVTHFKIKSAQEKFFLQQQGDELDKKIKVAEKEIVAIENTLKMINLTNVAFKNNLSPLKDDDVTIQEMKVLENKYKDWTQKCREAKQELAKHQAIFDDLTKELNEVLMPVRMENKELVDKLEEENIVIEKQERTKEEKLKRTETQIRKALKNLRSKDISIYDQDLEVRQLKDANNTVVKRLCSMMKEYADVAPNISKYSAEHNIDLKSQNSLSSDSFSTASSISSPSSTRSLTTRFNPVVVSKVDLSFN